MLTCCSPSLYVLFFLYTAAMALLPAWTTVLLLALCAYGISHKVGEVRQSLGRVAMIVERFEVSSKRNRDKSVYLYNIYTAILDLGPIVLSRSSPKKKLPSHGACRV
jgi:hypothetical protein